MPTKKETNLVNRIKIIAKDRGGMLIKIHGSAMMPTGFPDLIGWIPYEDGFIHLAIETKTAKGVVSRMQKYWLKEMSKAGYVAGVIRSIEDFEKLINDDYNKNKTMASPRIFGLRDAEEG